MAGPDQVQQAIYVKVTSRTGALLRLNSAKSGDLPQFRLGHVRLGAPVPLAAIEAR